MSIFKKKKREKKVTIDIKNLKKCKDLCKINPICVRSF